MRPGLPACIAPCSTGPAHDRHQQDAVFLGRKGVWFAARQPGHLAWPQQHRTGVALPDQPDDTFETLQDDRTVDLVLRYVLVALQHASDDFDFCRSQQLRLTGSTACRRAPKRDR